MSRTDGTDLLVKTEVHEVFHTVKHLRYLSEKQKRGERGREVEAERREQRGVWRRGGKGVITTVATVAVTAVITGVVTTGTDRGECVS